MGEEKTGRRKTSRFKAAFRVKYRNLDHLINAYTKNISKGGIFLRTDHYLPTNSIVSITLVLPGTKREIRCIARVVRVQSRDKVENERTCGMAMEFLDMSEENVRFIEETIARHAVKEGEESTPIRLERKLSVLVVDDDKFHRENGARAFLDKGHHVVTAENGLEALTICLKDPPDIVVTDVQMPQMDGWSFLRTIRARPTLASTLVIFQTTLASEKDRLKGYQLGVDDYIEKPYSPDELLIRVERLMSRALSRKRTSSNRALRGDLEQVSLPTVLSLLELERKTGVVIVVGEKTCRLFVRDGHPVDVEMEGAGSETSSIELALELLEWSSGQFEFAPQDVARTDTINKSMQGFLMETARLADERNRN